TVPSSWKKYVRRSRTERIAGAVSLAGGGGSVWGLLAIRVGGVAKAVPHEVEREDDDGDRDGRDEQTGRGGQGLDVLGLLEQHAPTDGRRPEAEAEEGERGLADDHGRDGQGGGRDDVAQERGHQVREDDPGLAAAGQLGSHHEVLLPQRQEAPAHHP